jgi:4-aminobutyrate aminotransferase/(S)-3-amino-2-methylpropionate transaminase
MSLEQKRILLTAIPGPESAKLQERRSEVVSAGVGTMLPTFITEAHGAILKDADGNQLIDMGSGIGVVTIGHTNPQLVEAVEFITIFSLGYTVIDKYTNGKASNG